MRSPSGSRWLPAAGFLVILASSSGSGIAGDRPLAGRVVDPAGVGIEGATILLTSAGHRADPVAPAGWGRPGRGVGEEAAVMRSDSEGGFSVVLPAGRYRVAAFRSGYDVSLTEVNTLVRASLEVRLREVASVVLGDLPVGNPGQNLGLDWILRRPASDALRQTEASVTASGAAVLDEPRDAPAATAPVPSGWLQALLEPIDGEFVQHFSGADPLEGDGARLRDATGRSTSLALRGAIGDQGTWRFDGLTGKSLDGVADGVARQGRRADQLLLGMDYRLGPDDSLRSEMRYGTSRYVVDSGGETVNATDQEQRTVGFRSRWDRTLGAAATLYVDGSYFETGVRTPDGERSPFASLPGAGGTDRVTDRSWLATAGVAFEAGDHRLDFGLRTKRYTYEERDRGVLLYSLYDAPTLAEPGEHGNAMSLFGGDDWHLARHYALNYGVRYHSDLSAGNAYFVPRVGMTFDPADGDGTRVRSMVLFRLDDPGLSALYATSAERRAARDRDIGRLGYMVQVERRPQDSLQFAATLSYRPFEEGVGGDPEDTLVPGAWGDALLFLTDGAAGRHELEVELQRRFGNFSGSLSGSIGRVEGRLTPAVEEAPVQFLALGEVRYYLTRLRALYGPTDTELQIDFRRVQGQGGGEGGADPSELDYRRVDLVVYQDLPWLRNASNARFKVLMAYQEVLYGSLYDGPAGGVGSGATSRVTGGVDISF
jgi:hypothetical protein